MEENQQTALLTANSEHHPSSPIHNCSLQPQPSPFLTLINLKQSPNCPWGQDLTPPNLQFPWLNFTEFIFFQALNFATLLMVIVIKRKTHTKKEENFHHQPYFFLLSIMDQRGEDKDKYGQPESMQNVRKMTPLDSGTTFHYLIQSIHSLLLERSSPKNTLSPQQNTVASWRELDRARPG